MKRLIKALLAVTMIVCLALTVVACNTDPCKDGHEWNDGEVTKAATCTEKGEKTFKCKNCDETKTEDIAIDASAHKFDTATHKCVCGAIDPEYAVAQIGEVNYLTIAEALAAGGEIKLLKDVEITTGLTVTKEVSIALNGHNITVPAMAEGSAIDMFLVDTNGKLTISGEGNVTNNNVVGYIVYAQGTGEVTLEGGTFYTVDCTIVQVKNNAKAYVKGGSYSVKGEDQYGTTFMLNKMDADRATTVIEVTGGTFKGFNPADNAAEGEATNFVKSGFKSTSKTVGDDTVYTVEVCGHIATVDNVCSDCGYELTEAEVLDVLFSLKDDKPTAGTYKLSGLVTEVGFFNTQYNNIQVTIQVAGKSVLCYGLIGSEDCPLAADTLKEGQTITVSGHFVYIYNKFEFNANCQLLKVEYGQANINVEIENGATTLPKTATNCDTVEFTVTPDAGFRIDEVKVNGRIITAVEGKYSFNVLGDMKVAVIIVPESQKAAEEIVNFDFSNSEIKTEESKVQAYYQEWTAKLGDYSMLVDNFNNNKWGWNFIRAGHKEYTNKGTMQITLTESVSKIIVTVDNVNNDFMGNVTLNVKNAAGEIVETVVIEAKDVLAGHLTFRLSEPAANCTYELEFDTSTPSGKTNGYLQISSVAFYGYAEV